jgi:hypothetical protein
MPNSTFVLDQLLREIKSYLEIQNEKSIPQRLRNAIEMADHILYNTSNGVIEVVYNNRYGGYSLSKQACLELGEKWDGYCLAYENDRSNPRLVEVVKRLGRDANGSNAELAIARVPAGVLWHIQKYDGLETVVEDHRSFS